LRLAHLPLDRPVAAVSGGEATRLALAAHLVTPPDALLLDEPTNDLDAVSREAVYALVEQWRRGLVVASHDRALLQRVDRIVALEDGTAVSYGGGWSLYREELDRQRTAARRERESARAELRRAERHRQEVRERQSRRDAAGRRERASGSQPKLVLNAKRERSQGTGARLEEMVTRVAESARRRLRAADARVHEQAPLAVVMPSSGLAAGTTVVALHAVDVGPAPGVVLLREVSFHVQGAERVALTGPNGSGKSTLLRLLAGVTTPAAGRVHRGVPLSRVAFLDQRTRLLDRGRTVLDAFAAHHPALDVTAVRAALARFHFRADAARQTVASLSGGERMRAALACGLAGAEVPQCLVLDEPTNHLDLSSLEGVEGALREYDGAIIVASHDETFLDSIGVARREQVEQWRNDSAPQVGDA
jgi:ATPase subunit of ABC transporter with duplicated ATPase domains